MSSPGSSSCLNNSGFYSNRSCLSSAIDSRSVSNNKVLVVVVSVVA